MLICLSAVFLTWCLGFMYKAQLSESIHEAPKRTKMSLQQHFLTLQRQNRKYKAAFSKQVYVASTIKNAVVHSASIAVLYRHCDE